ncbi:hypothetical protein EST62_03310 [Chlorobaculum sp. 24CR]|jgi:hypothetical protein|uniref:hypothetical protein n=1 Tax=Chlorobaculum sp. 24CR TaxID=2508878 RepID=UPI00100AC4F4|nr:hypothetical protein [Chlorobaculum sp. 24CR]RXK88394.1 hypothetical protein EST62_03310 [Chlorobaculum sp. 24CR]
MANANIKWKGEITFEGSADEFNTFKEMLQKSAVKVTLPDSDLGKLIDIHFAGYIRPRLDVIFKADRLKKLTEGAQRIPFKIVEGIAGGIQTPHIHVGDEVVLVSKEQFKEVIGEVARTMAIKDIDAATDYVGMVRSVMR